MKDTRMKKSAVPFFCFVMYFFAFNPQACSQEAYSSQSFEPDKNKFSPKVFYDNGSKNKITNYPKLFYNDLAFTLNSITSELPVLSRSSLILMAGSLMSFGFVDRELSEQTFHENRNYAERQLDNITNLTEQPLLIGFASLTLGHVFKKDQFAEMGLKIMEGAVITTGIVAPIKFISGRSRPNQGTEQNNFYPLQRGYSSFPSGHTANIFTFATIVSSYYPQTTKYAYGVAGLVGLQRISSGKHWASDVLVGAFIGHYIGKILTKQHDASSPLNFHLGLNKVGISLSF